MSATLESIPEVSGPVAGITKQPTAGYGLSSETKASTGLSRIKVSNLIPSIKTLYA
ncbi:MAG: hypothetical protein ACLVEU_11500 [Bacteroides cellulosilyticus]